MKLMRATNKTKNILKWRFQTGQSSPESAYEQASRLVLLDMMCQTMKSNLKCHGGGVAHVLVSATGLGLSPELLVFSCC